MPRFWLYARNGKRYGADAPSLTDAMEAARSKGLDILEGEPDLPFEDRWAGGKQPVAAPPTSPSPEVVVDTRRRGRVRVWLIRVIPGRWIIPRVGQNQNQRDVTMGVMNAVVLLGLLGMLLDVSFQVLLVGTGEYLYNRQFDGAHRLIDNEPVGYARLSIGFHIPLAWPWVPLLRDEIVSTTEDRTNLIRKQRAQRSTDDRTCDMDQLNQKQFDELMKQWQAYYNAAIGRGVVPENIPMPKY